MNRIHKHSYFSVKQTTLEHQVLIVFYHMSLYVQEEIQTARFINDKTIYNKTLAPDT